MNKLVKLIVISSLFLFSSCALAHKTKDEKHEHTKEEKEAIKAAEKWLKMYDKQDYAGTWNKAAKFFKDALPKKEWIKELRKVKKKIGRVKTRELVRIKEETNVPKSPEGKYMVLVYKSKFKKQDVTEVVTPFLEKDGTWRVIGYYVE